MIADSIRDGTTSPLPPQPHRPRVLLVTGAYPPEISSGGLQCQMVARALQSRIHFEILTTALDSALSPRSVVDGVAVSRVVLSGAGRRANVQAAPRMIAALLRLVRDTDLVHVHGYSRKTALAVAMARLCRVPVVLSLHTSGFDDPAAIRQRGRLARWALDAVDLCMTVSPGLRDACLASGMRPDKLHYVPNGVDLDRFRPSSVDERRALRRALGIPEERPVILFVGFFSQDKQPHVLFEAWLRWQQRTSATATLVFVGATRSQYFEVDDQLAPAMRDAARRAGVADRLMFVEPTPRVHEYFRAADLFVLPSAREGLPVTLLEAMASGLPAVVSRLPGSTDGLVEDWRTGVLVAPGDVDGFALAIERLMADGEQAAGIGRTARLQVERGFGVDRTARGWLDAYRSLSGKFA